MRTCVVCREHATKRALLRIVRQPDQSVLIDQSGRLNGRGTYLCDKPECLKKGAETEILSKALNAPIPADVRKVLRTLSLAAPVETPAEDDSKREVE
jgi:predicted RNA-binding protein YlxR (DUF448 family)